MKTRVPLSTFGARVAYSRLSSLDHDKVLGPRSTYGSHRDRVIERHQSSPVLHGQRKQVDVGELLGAENAGAFDQSFVEERNVVWPEGVAFGFRVSASVIERSANRDRRRVTRLRYHSNEAILREWTGCSTVIAILRPPLVNPRLVKMVRIYGGEGVGNQRRGRLGRETLPLRAFVGWPRTRRVPSSCPPCCSPRMIEDAGRVRRRERSRRAR